MSVDYEAINQEAVALAKRALTGLRAEPPGRVLFSAISGGHMYGFPSPDSDLDIRGCHVLPAAEMLGLRSPKETFELMGEWFEGVEIDWVSHDLRKYLKLLMKNGGYILEQVLSPLVVEAGPEFLELRELARGAMTRQVLYHYGGFYNRQRKMVEGEEPLLAKSVLYMFRVVMSGTHLLETGELETDIQVLNELLPVPYLPDLWTLKAESKEKATLPEAERARCLEDAAALEARMSAALETSPLPAELQNHDALNDFLLRMRSS